MCQNILTILVLIVNRNGEDICHHLKRKENLHFGILSLILKLEMTICLICNCELDETILDLIQRSTLSAGLGLKSEVQPAQNKEKG